jgi:hypothetical protein
MGDISMGEWQPARFVNVHPEEGIAATSPSGRLIYVRETTPDPEYIALYRELGCDAQRFFLVSDKPEGGAMYGRDSRWIGWATCCEHEILTD